MEILFICETDWGRYEDRVEAVMVEDNAVTVVFEDPEAFVVEGGRITIEVYDGGVLKESWGITEYAVSESRPLRLETWCAKTIRSRYF